MRAARRRRCCSPPSSATAATRSTPSCARAPTRSCAVPATRTARRDRGESLLRGSGTFAQVAYGNEVTSQAGDVPDQPLGVPEEAGLATIDIAGKPWRSLALKITDFGNPRLQIASSLAPVEERVGRIRRLVLLLGAIALALTASPPGA